MTNDAQTIDEPIEVAEYNPEWPRFFEEEAERLRAGIGRELHAVEHFGSTSVPGMVGKPVVDLLIGVEDMEEAHKLAEEVVSLGYENFGEALIPGRVYLRQRGRKNFNVVIVVHHGDRWNYFLLLRDYLRAHPDEVKAYSEAKLAAVKAGGTTFRSYSINKQPFLEEMAERAIAWQRGVQGRSARTQG